MLGLGVCCFVFRFFGFGMLEVYIDYNFIFFYCVVKNNLR